MDHLVIIFDINPSIWFRRGLSDISSSNSFDEKLKSHKSHAEAGSIPTGHSQNTSPTSTNSGAVSDSSFLSVFSQLLIFINAFLLLSRQNRFSFIATHPLGNQFIFPSAPVSAAADNNSNNSYNSNNSNSNSETMMIEEELSFNLSQLSERLKNSMLEILQLYRERLENNTDENQSQSAILSPTSLLAGGLTMALCHLNRLAARSMGPKIRQRILILSVSEFTQSQYIPLMNCYFTAQKSSILIDSCVIADNIDSLVLQQGSHLTKGIYLRIGTNSSNFDDKTNQDSITKLELIHNHQENSKSSFATAAVFSNSSIIPSPVGFSPAKTLLQYLIQLFLPDSSLRSHLSLPVQPSIDFRATCFCHREPKDSVYVCPVCLAIFCRRAVKCAVCGTRFSMELNPISGPIGVPQTAIKKQEEKKEL